MRQTCSLLLLLGLFSLGQCHRRGPAEGESCSQFVRSPDRCAEPEQVTETVEPVDEMERFG